MHKKKPNLNKKDRDKDIGHQTARSAKKKKKYSSTTLCPNSRPVNVRLQNYFLSKPDQLERMAGDMKTKAFVLPEVISATNDIFKLENSSM